MAPSRRGGVHTDAFLAAFSFPMSGLHCAAHDGEKPAYSDQAYADLPKVGIASKHKCVAGKTLFPEALYVILYENMKLRGEQVAVGRGFAEAR